MANVPSKGFLLKRLWNENERRKWPRLPLAIPIFVRSQNAEGKNSLELATALNVSAGGALVAVRRPLTLATRVSLKVPTPPSVLVAHASKDIGAISARTIRISHEEGYQLTALQFLRPLGDNHRNGKRAPRNVDSPV